MRVIYENDYVVIWAADQREATIALLTFSAWTASPPGSCFATDFASKYNMFGIFFCAKQNDWWEYFDPDRVRNLIDEELNDRTRISYGSSMGGFGAIAFANIFNCSKVIAISPQATVDRNVVPWENRWIPYRNNTDNNSNILGIAGKNLTKNIEMHLIYDPMFIADRKHIDLIVRASDAGSAKIVHHKFSWSGHPSGTALREISLLSKLILSIIRNECVVEITKQYKNDRWKSNACAFGFLSNRQMLDRHPKLLVSVSEQFLQRPFWNAKLGFLRARALVRIGRMREAELELKALRPKNQSNKNEIDNLIVRISKLNNG